MISIVVPVYNVEKYLPRCLDSLVGQTYRDLEIICFNDGSTDGSLSILERYAEMDERLKLVSQKNQGLSSARNVGMEKAQGEWIMFVDSDDWLETGCLEKTIALSDNQDLVFFSYVREFENSSAPKQVLGMDSMTFDETDIMRLYERLLAPNGDELGQPEKIDSLSTAWGKMYRTDIIRNHRLCFVSTEEIGTEDLLFNVEYFSFLRHAQYLAQCLYHYRKSTLSTLSSLYKENLDAKWLRLFEQIYNVITPLNCVGLIIALERRKALCLLGLGLNITFSQKTWLEQLRMLNDILTSSWYIRAIAQLNTSPLPLHWRCFYGMARRKQTWAVLLMLQVINRIINR